MESIISNLLSRFEKGSLSRRELVQGLAMLAASGMAASAQEDINFKSANIDHVSVQVGSLQRSVDFYQKMFGFTVVSQAEEGGVKIVRLGNTKTLVSLNVGGPPGRVDHFAIGIPRFTRDSITSYFDPARRDSLTRRLGRFAHQRPRWSQRANFFSELIGRSTFSSN